MIRKLIFKTFKELSFGQNLLNWLKLTSCSGTRKLAYELPGRALGTNINDYCCYATAPGEPIQHGGRGNRISFLLSKAFISFLKSRTRIKTAKMAVLS